MNKHLEKYLSVKYPKIFKNIYGPIDQTCMARGIACDDGWFFLLDDLCSQIQDRVDCPPKIKRNNLSNYLKRSWNFLTAVIPMSFKNKLKYKLYFYLTYEDKKIDQVVVNYIKEKFGTLRFNCSGGDEYIQGLVEFAQYLSGSICEKCGKLNEHVGHTTMGWIQTLCACCLQKVDVQHQKKWKPKNQDLLNLWQKVSLEKKKNL
jgi:hypothetical protein